MSISTAEKIIIANDDINHDWTETQANYAVKFWNDGWDVWDMAKVLKRHVDEVAIFLIDRARKGYIQERPGGVFGRSVAR